MKLNGKKIMKSIKNIKKQSLTFRMLSTQDKLLNKKFKCWSILKQIDQTLKFSKLVKYSKDVSKICQFASVPNWLIIQ
jgi:hypothetical protein